MIAAILTVTSNDRLRDILPYLRLRHGEPTLFSQTAWALLWIGLAVLVALYIRGRLQQRRRRRREFRDLGLDLGLNDGELRLAMSVAHRDHMKRPHLLLTSVSVFERHVGAYASHLASSDLHHPVLKRIRQLRTALGFDITAADRALTSSRQLEKGQMLMISAGGEEGGGQFSPWLLVDRDEGVIPVVPRLREDADYFDDLAPGDRLSVRLWREADTEYCFDTQLVARDRGTGTFLLRHSAKVERVQQRDFFRVEASFDIALFGMNDADSGGEGAIEGSGAERDSAAIVLLDTPEGEVASSPDQERDSSPLRGDPPPPSDQTAGVQDRKEHSVDIPDNAPRVDGRVSNISAGGLGMTVTGALPAADRWLVDPAFDGPFPLAGVICRVIGDRRQDDLTVLKLKFEELPTSVESEIVRQVFQYQLLQSGGIRPTGPTEQ